VVFEGAVGVADLAEPRPMTADDLVRIGSVTKTYVSVLALQLEAEGLLSRADTVERWLPDMVPGGGSITVEMLLRMRSGLPDYGGDVFGDERDLEPLRRCWTPEELIAEALTNNDRKLPGTVHRYCNADYVLLGLIVERASQQRVDALLWQRICEPLGLASTIFPTADPYLRGPHAKGHLRVRDEWLECTTLSMSEAWTAGAIAASARDVAKFFDALFNGQLLDADSFARMTDGAEVYDEQMSRGIGLVRYDFGTGTIAYGHHGGVPGYTTIAMHTGNRAIVLCQNGIDVNRTLTSDAPFIQEALKPSSG
jgi:D-alanyl-D-alanine carboxypeptidase